MPKHLTRTLARTVRPLRSVGSWWPVAGASLLFAVAIGALVVRAMAACGGHFGYPMDDTYIHMAMAKNFSNNGTWGVTAYGFSSSTSSPLFTLLLACCYKITGVHEITPFILNIISALALLGCCDFILRIEGIRPSARFRILGVLVLAVPLPILAYGGMEHVLHALLTVLFAYLCALSLQSKEGERYLIAWLWTLSGVLVITRYEGLFLIASGALLFVWRRRVLAASGLVVCGVAPVLVYGAISVKHGWFMLPTSLILKANLPAAPSSGMYPGFLLSLFRNATRGSHVVMLIVVAAFFFHRVYRKHSGVWTPSGTGLILFILTASMHLTLARTGWFFRYEAYLVVLGIMVVAIAAANFGIPKQRSFKVAFLFLCSLLGARTIYAFSVATQAATDIFDQQYQMGRFVKQFLNDQTIVINDIGAVSFLSDARVLDWIGLGSVEPARARMQRKYDTEWLSFWALGQHASVAIFNPKLAPPKWKPIASWTIPGNVMSGSDTVNFYALDAKTQKALPAELQTFRASLPARVVTK